MENTSQSNMLIIEARKGDGSQNASIKLPLGLLHFSAKLLKLLPQSVRDNIDQELRAKGLDVSFDVLLAEGHETLIKTLRDVQIHVEDEKQKFSCYVI